MSIPTVLVLPGPGQGHVSPMMTFSQKLVEQGFHIIFVNTEFVHEKVVSSMEKQGSLSESPIKFVSIPDGLAPDHDRNNDFGRELFRSILSTMPANLEKLIEAITLNGGIRISCVIADVIMGWALEVACKLGIKGALLWTAPAAMFALQNNIPKLIDEGIIDSDGLPITRKTFQLSPSMPVMDTGFIWWSNVFDPKTEKEIFNNVVQCMKSANLTEWWLCNSTHELEPGALSSVPKLVPIGPLLTSNDNRSATARSLGQFWEEDLSCLSWLDRQPHHSVLYVAFGSITHFDQKQFTELAFGLELMDRPFLWVVRQDPSCNNKVSYPDEFKGSRGKIVGWAPQPKVLSHPAIACFVSHCGWNSSIESLSSGVPFLCWPYYCDQFYVKTLICDELKVGLGFDPDENELVSREEIKTKVDQLLNDENIRSKSHKLKEELKKNTEKGGRSSQNLSKFVKWVKE